MTLSLTLSSRSPDQCHFTGTGEQLGVQPTEVDPAGHTMATIVPAVPVERVRALGQYTRMQLSHLTTRPALAG